MLASTAKPRVRIPREGIFWWLVIALLLAIALVKNINLILILACVMVALFLTNFLMVRRRLKCVDISVEIPQATFAQELALIQLRLSNTSETFIHNVECQVKWAHQLGKTLFLSIPPRTSKPTTLSLTPADRGYFGNAVIVLSCKYPFGLVESRVKMTIAVRTWVYPRRGRLKIERMLQLVPNRASHQEWRRPNTRTVASGLETHGLRPFRPGDSPRWIHWRTSARVGSPMVREFDQSTTEQLVVIAFLDQPSVQPELRFLATLVDSWSQQTEAPLFAALKSPSGWHRIHVQNRRDSEQLLQTLAEWPKTSADPVLTDTRLVERRTIDGALTLLASRGKRDLPESLKWLRPTHVIDLDNPPPFYQSPDILDSQHGND